MTGLELLERCRGGAQDIDRMIDQLNRLYGCGVSQEEPRARDLNTQIGMRRQMLDMERVAACKLCDMLPEPECTLMYRYYVLGQTQGEIVTEMHYSVGYYKKKKKSGLQIITLIPEETVQNMIPEDMKKAPLG